MNCGHVAVAGRPNVGKSTLFNRLLNKRLSIVTAKPNTTRYCIEGVITNDTAQIVLIDTPGWRKVTKSNLDKTIQQNANLSIPHVDLGLVLVNSKRLFKEDQAIINLYPSTTKIIVAINKVDLIKQEEALTIAQEINTWGDINTIIPISAKSGFNCDELIKEISKLLPQTSMLYPKDKVTDKNDSFFIADFIREQVLKQMSAELPYKIAIQIKAIQRKQKTTVIMADILVDTKSRQAMFIGSDGKKLKAIGTNARKVIESYLHTKVYLDLKVTLKPNWHQQASILARLGLAGDIV